MKTLLLLFCSIISFNTLRAQYTVNGAAASTNCHCYILTPDVQGESGSVWNNNKIDLGISFDFQFNVFLGCNDGGGADGMVFALQPISTSVGSSGGGMGFENITPSVGLTLDTYQNTNYNDPPYDHIDFQYNGDITHIGIPPPISATSDNVEDCNWHTLRITWDAINKVYAAYFDGVLRLSTTNDLVNTIFNGDPKVFWGFTGSTGGASNLQQFCTALSPAYNLLPSQKKCVGEPIKFYDSTISFAPLLKRYWDFGDGTPIDSTSINPVHIFTTAGDYTVLQTVIGIDGCTEINQQILSIGGKPTAAFSMNNACADSTIYFKAMSTAQVNTTINQWNWDLSSGVTSNQQNPSHAYALYAGAGPLAVKLAVKTMEGCSSDTVTNYLKIFPRPVANFTDVVQACSDVAVNFTDSSYLDPSGNTNNSSISNWAWDFGNGQVSATKNNSIVFATTGHHPVTLTVRTDSGCSSLPVTRQVNILPRPTAYFTNSTVCQSAVTSFTDSSYTSNGDAIKSWWWNLGNGTNATTQNATATYASATNITVQLVVKNSNNCVSDTLSKVISINGKPVAAFSMNNACADSTVHFTDASTGQVNTTINQWNWDLSSGVTSTLQNPSHAYALYAGAGPLAVKLAVKTMEGCSSDTVTNYLKIFPRPIANFTDVVQACSDVAVNFTDSSYLDPSGNTNNSSISNWAWDFGNGQVSATKNNSISFASTGNHPVTLTVRTDSGCSSLPVTRSVNILPRPTAYFTNSTVCQSAVTSFTDSSYTSNGDAIKGWWWNLGNGTNATTQNASATYASATNITVQLVVKNSNNCVSDTLSKVITINGKPVAAFNFNNACADSAVHFTDASAGQGGTINQWNWDLSSGVTSTLQNPSHAYALYAGAGPLAVRLAVKTMEGCSSDTVTNYLKIFPRPVANFTDVVQACSDVAVSFTDSSYLDPSGNTNNSSISNWAWDFGNGQVSATKNNSIVFSNTGNHPVTLTVRTDSGCSSLPVTRSVNILPRPTAYFTNSTVCQSAVTSFTDSSYTSNGDAIKGWWWNLGNGTSVTTQNATATYASATNITVQLVVKNSNNCVSDTLSKVITINGKPIAAFNFNNACADSTVHFTDVSTGQVNTTINQWNWDLSSGVTSTLQNPSHAYALYAGAGPLAVRLAVKTMEGCSSDTVTNYLKIFPRPVANFTDVVQACANTTINFTDSSYLDPSGNTNNSSISNWAWDFGNGQVSTTKNNSIVFAATGNHPVTLTVRTDSGCSSLPVTRQVNILPRPTAYFTNSTVCQSAVTSFTDSSYTSNGDAIKGWWWNLGNGTNATTQNASATYASATNVTVQLVVKNSNNCVSDTLSKVIAIGAKPIANFGEDLPLCSNIIIQFRDLSTTSTGTIQHWNWLFDNLNSSSIQNSSTTLTAGQHVIKLAVKNIAGCLSDTISKNLLVNEAPRIGFSFEAACKNESTNFIGIDYLTTTISSWKWNLGDGTRAVLKNTKHVYTTFGTYKISLIATSAAGCIAEKDSSILIYGAKVFAGNDTISAPNQPIQLQVTGGLKYQWSPSAGLNNDTIANPVATNAYDQTYYLKAITPTGCESYDTISIKIFTGPELYLPNAFSPNGDGLNDVFRIFPVGMAEFDFMTIYNRYGQIIFSTKNVTMGWDGTFKNNPQLQGVYIWMVSGKDYKGNKVVKKGTIMLVR